MIYGIYRAKWNLPADHPMVAPSYSATRSQLARDAGLGQVAAAPAETPADVPAKSAAAEEPAKAPRRGRAKKAG